MSDFYQHESIGTLHHLGEPSLEELEQKLVKSAGPRPIALVIPVSLEDSRHNNFRKILKVVA
ncbi:MAG: glycosyl transferase, partial [Candidatus Glassbacteria bacterium]|nr:glycosyl transferase [Candidatus Glassbacteria bacterium]